MRSGVLSGGPAIVTNDQRRRTRRSRRSRHTPGCRIQERYSLFLRELRALRGLSKVQRQRGGSEIDDADVAIEIERSLNLREVRVAHQRLLVREERGDKQYAAQVQRREMCHLPEGRH